jgi:hypothetical protein
VGHLTVHRLIDLEARRGPASLIHDSGRNTRAKRARAFCSNNNQAGQSGIGNGEDQ